MRFLVLLRPRDRGRLQLRGCNYLRKSVLRQAIFHCHQLVSLDVGRCYQVNNNVLRAVLQNTPKLKVCMRSRPVCLVISPRHCAVPDERTVGGGWRESSLHSGHSKRMRLTTRGIIARSLFTFCFILLVFDTLHTK